MRSFFCLFSNLIQVSELFSQCNTRCDALRMCRCVVNGEPGACARTQPWWPPSAPLSAAGRSLLLCPGVVPQPISLRNLFFFTQMCSKKMPESAWFEAICGALKVDVRESLPHYHPSLQFPEVLVRRRFTDVSPKGVFSAFPPPMYCAAHRKTCCCFFCLTGTKASNVIGISPALPEIHSIPKC